MDMEVPSFFHHRIVRRGGALLLSINTGQKEAPKAGDVREYPLTVVLSTQKWMAQISFGTKPKSN
jgi:hypothetical protein